MCGRYTITSPNQAAIELGEFLALGPSPELAPRFNVAPTQRAPVVANRAAPAIESFRWGLVPRWADDLAIGTKMINARGETLADKPAYRDAYARRRCLVLSDGFFEWRGPAGRRTPMWIRRGGGGLMVFAGLWDTWRGPDGAAFDSFTIVTTAAGPRIAALHDRMPVVLEPADWARWLHPEPLPPEALGDLLRPAEPADLAIAAVSSTVNSVANEGPACVAPPAQGDLFG